MSFLAKGKKEDLKNLCTELNLEFEENFKISDFKNLIQKSKDYDNDFTIELFTTIVSDRKDREEQEKLKEERQLEQEKLREERQFELDRLRLQATQNASRINETVEFEKPRVDFQKLIPKFNTNDDMSIFLILFERQLKFLQVAEDRWVTHLIGALPTDISKLIAREPEDKSQDYSHIKNMLLKRFKLSGEKFRQLFTRHKKVPDSTWKDFYFEIQTYFEGWLTELNVNDFQTLKNLIISDQIKKNAPVECREHFMDQWPEFISPGELADKLDHYESIRRPVKKPTVVEGSKNKFQDKTRTYSYAGGYRHFDRSSELGKPVEVNLKPDSTNGRPPLKCYGCGTPGFIKARCPTCKSSAQSESVNFSSSIQMYTCLTSPNQVATLDVSIMGLTGTACADTGATRSIASDYLYHKLLVKKTEFEKCKLTMVLADGVKSYVDVLSTDVVVNVGGKSVLTNFIVLPKAKDNRTLLGVDFLEKAGIVLDVRNKEWYFSENPSHKFNFAGVRNFETQQKPLDSAKFHSAIHDKEVVPHYVTTLSQGGDPTLLSNNRTDLAKKSVIITDPVVDEQFNSCSLREEEGKHLPDNQRRELDSLLQEYESVFQPGGEATPFMEHHIDIGEHLPVSVPPYRMSPAKKEILKKEIDDLLEKGIIEECESPFAAPVVLVPKPNGKIRLCVDYRKLNEITVPDSYPLPRMDDLLQDAKHTAYMSTIDLRSGYHQDRRKEYANKSRRAGPQFCPGDHVWVELHPVSKAGKQKSAKFMPRRDGPYVIRTIKSPTTYEVSSIEAPDTPLGVYHVSALKPCQNTDITPVAPLRKRGRPKKTNTPRTSTTTKHLGYANFNRRDTEYQKIYQMSSPINRTVYCGGLSTGLSDSVMHKTFSAFGHIQYIKTFNDRDYAFIKFSNKEAATHAILKMNNSKINDQLIKCAWSKESENSYVNNQYFVT